MKTLKEKINLLYIITILLVLMSVLGLQSQALAANPNSKIITDYRDNDLNQFTRQIYFDDGTYEGILSQEGAVEQVLKYPEEGQDINELEVSTGDNEPPATYYHQANGLSGTLNLTRSEVVTREVDLGTWETINDPRFFSEERSNTATVIYDAAGNIVEITYSWDNTNDHPRIYIDEDGYKGWIDRVRAYQDGGTQVIPIAGGGRKEINVWVGVYEGTIQQREVYTPNIQIKEIHIGYYSGRISKPAEYHFRQNYRGLVYQKAISKLNLGDAPNNNCEKIGDPVNAVTGNYYLTETDLSVSDLGMALEITRYYNSLAHNTSGSMGKGWGTNYDTSLTIKGSGEVTIVYPDGHIVIFKPDGNGKYSTPETVFDQLTKVNDSQYELKLQSKEKYIYGNNGKLLAISDQNGNNINLEYDYSNHLKKIVGAGGQSLTFTTENGRIKTITDSGNRNIHYDYDGQGNLVQVRKPNGGLLKYEYNAYGLTAVIDENNRNFVSNVYDDFGRILKQYDENENLLEFKYEYDSIEDTRTQVIDGNSNVRYEYNDQLYITKKIFNDGTYEAYTYDEWGNKNSIRDRKGNVTTYIYDEKGNLLEQTSAAPFNYKTQYYYDDNNNLIKIVNPDTSTIIYEYDANHNVTKIITKIDQATEAIKEYTYDNYGRVTSIKDGDLNTTVYEYAGHNKPTKVIEPEGNSITYNYDNLNRVTAATTAYGTTTLIYNHNDDVEKIIDPSGNITRTKYDPRGNPIKLIKPEQYNSAVDDGAGYSYEYDALDLLLKTTDPMGAVSAVKYDQWGNKTKQINPNYYNSSNDDGIGFGYEYDSNHQLIKTINPSGQQSRIKYDAAGNLIKYIDANNYNEQTDNGSGVEYVYDQLDRLVEVKAPDGNIVRRLVYDSMGRIIKDIDAKGYLSGSNDTTRYGIINKYNLAGWLTERRTPMKMENGKVYYKIEKYNYSLTGRILEESHSADYVLENGEPGSWYALNYTYNQNGKITTVSDSEGAGKSYEYDGLGQIIQEKTKIDHEKYVTSGYKYDRSGNLIEQWVILDGSSLDGANSGEVIAKTTFGRDKNGNITRITSPEGYVDELTYDLADRVVEHRKEVIKDQFYIQKEALLVTLDRTVVYLGNEYECKLEIEPDTYSTELLIGLIYNSDVLEIVAIEPLNEGVTYSISESNISITGSTEVYNERTTIAKIRIKAKEGISGTGYILIDPDSSYINGNGERCKFTQGFGKTLIVQQPDMNNNSKVEIDDFTITALLKGIEKGTPEYNHKFDIDDDGVINTSDLDYLKNWLIDNRSTVLIPEEPKKFLPEFLNGSLDLDSQSAIRVTRYQYDKAGNLLKVIYSNGYMKQYAYDEYNRLISLTNEENAVYRWSYDEVGNITHNILPENNTGTEYVYDVMNRLVEIKDPLGKVIQRNIYDLNGNLIKIIDGNGYQSSGTDTGRYGVEYTYDLGGRCISIATPESQKNGKYSSVFTYDAYDNLITHVDGESHTTTYQRNRQGQPLKVTNALTQQTRYEYDYVGNLTKYHDANNNVTQYKYNNQNLLKEIIDTEGQSTLYKYDQEGRLKRESQRNGEIVTYQYNQDHNLIMRHAQLQNQTDRYFYNEHGQLLGGVNQYGYDLFEYTPAGYIQAVVHNGQNVLAYQYNKEGKITGITDKTGKTASYTYDQAGRLTQVYDEGMLIAAYSYNPNDTTSSVTYGNNSSISYTYDRDQRITNIRQQTPLGIVGENSYTYDNNGNVIRKTEGGGSHVYTYDKLNRLSSTIEPGKGNDFFNYDKVGNRLAGNGVRYAYDNRNRITQSSDNNGTTAYIYDNNGNLISENNNGAITSYKYDGFNQLIETTKPDGQWMANEYNPWGIRTASNINGTRNDYIYALENIITATNANEQTTARYIRGKALIAQEVEAQGYSYYMVNGHGDITHLIGSTGEINNQYRYDAFGNITEQKETMANPFKYAGEQYDSFTGHYYLRNRYYNPEAGRFTQEDKYLGDTENDQTRNRYIYVLNNPQKYIDPSGLSQQNIYPDYHSWWLKKEIEKENQKWEQRFESASGTASDFIIKAVKFMTVDWDDPSLLEFAGMLFKPGKACVKVAKPASKVITEALEKAAKGTDKVESMFGSKGTQVTSKTIWKQKGSQSRIDVENPNPGQRPGQIHYQDANGTKYLFDSQKQLFVDKNGNIAPKSVNSNLNNADFVKKLNVGLEQYLGEKGIKIP